MTDTHDLQPSRVLLVEDDPGHARLVQIALAELGRDVRIRTARDGVEALEALRAGTEPPPELVLLDLNLPKLGGHEVLAEIRADERLKQLTVVVLTTSADPEDEARARELGAVEFVTKPNDYSEYLRTLKSLEHLLESSAA